MGRRIEVTFKNRYELNRDNRYRQQTSTGIKYSVYILKSRNLRSGKIFAWENLKMHIVRDCELGFKSVGLIDSGFSWIRLFLPYRFLVYLGPGNTESSQSSLHLRVAVWADNTRPRTSDKVESYRLRSGHGRTRGYKTFFTSPVNISSRIVPSTIVSLREVYTSVYPAAAVIHRVSFCCRQDSNTRKYCRWKLFEISTILLRSTHEMTNASAITFVKKKKKTSEKHPLKNDNTHSRDSPYCRPERNKGEST